MLNTDDFIKRLDILFEYYGLNASSFADKIGVQRSSISHLLSGRNKPSLDFVLKIMDVFPDLNLYWILTGKGNLLQSETKATTTDGSTETNVPPTVVLEGEKGVTQPTQAPNAIPIPPAGNMEPRNGSGIHKIVIFYTDGTFEDFAQKKENPNPKMN